jgi:hypothetical protein
MQEKILSYRFLSRVVSLLRLRLTRQTIVLRLASFCLYLIGPALRAALSVEKREGALATYESPRCATLTEGRVFVTRSTSRSYIVSLRSDSKKESPVERWLSPDERVRFVDISFIGQSNRNRECADECSATRRSCRK